ncbi:MAG: hypothetical protein COT15_02825 [Candidatus Diapherotrites archaeon CG08_land_8_20_14_0_20_34_12]|nr:MAG: hypothetical protein COT15_02825 [Candidatus Diapherotrites archaeon CG08_land_8_20_14_0_20_34_12]
MSHVIYFSQIYKKPIYDDIGNKIGILKDLAFNDGEDLAEITYFVVQLNGKILKFPWKYIASLGHAIYLNVTKEKLSCCELQDTDLLITEVLLDKQLVDVDGLKIVRVNDILLSKIENKFYISSVGVGTRSLMRRLGLESVANTINPQIKEHLVPWAYVQPLSLSEAHLHVKVHRSKINDVHPADIADLMEELSYSERDILFNVLSEETAAETFAESEPEIQKSLIEHMHEQKINSILKRLSPAEMADLLGIVSKERLKSLMKQLDEKIIKKIENIWAYPDKSAGAVMRTDFFAIPQNFSAAQTISFLRKPQKVDEPYYLYAINDDKKLVGVISSKHLLLMKPKTKVKEFMSPNVLYVHVKDSLKKVAKTFSKYHVYALPVVDENEKLVGVVAMSDVFEEIVPDSWRKNPVIAKRLRIRRKKLEKNGAN